MKGVKVALCGVECVKLIFKTSVLSKICRLALVTNIPTAIIGLLSKIQKEFL